MEKKRFLRIYLILIIALGILSIVDYLLTTFTVTTNIYFVTISFLFLLFFLFNILVIPILTYQRQKKITYVLPIYHIIKYISLFLLGAVIKFLQITWSNLWIIIISLGIGLALLEIIFALYLMKKLGLFNQ
ncbi:MAG: hypothetical protein ABIH82_02985 [Candidatus Woesearchaeota archaeon]